MMIVKGNKDYEAGHAAPTGADGSHRQAQRAGAREGA